MGRKAVPPGVPAIPEAPRTWPPSIRAPPRARGAARGFRRDRGSARRERYGSRRGRPRRRSPARKASHHFVRTARHGSSASRARKKRDPVPDAATLAERLPPRLRVDRMHRGGDGREGVADTPRPTGPPSRAARARRVPRPPSDRGSRDGRRTRVRSGRGARAPLPSLPRRGPPSSPSPLLFAGRAPRMRRRPPPPPDGESAAARSSCFGTRERITRRGARDFPALAIFHSERRLESRLGSAHDTRPGHESRFLRGARTARGWRYGRGLSGPRSQARARRRDQGSARGLLSGPGAHHPIRPRGPIPRLGESPGARRDLRTRRIGRHPLHRDGARAGRDSLRDARPRPPFRFEKRSRPRGRSRRRSRRRTRKGSSIAT
jgi:hypothetical protein